jgi:hypothetical protein
LLSLRVWLTAIATMIQPAAAGCLAMDAAGTAQAHRQPPALDHDRRSRQFQHDAEHQTGIIAAAPAANQTDEHRTQRADRAADCVGQAHDDDKARGVELAMNDQRR